MCMNQMRILPQKKSRSCYCYFGIPFFMQGKCFFAIKQKCLQPLPRVCACGPVVGNLCNLCSELMQDCKLLLQNCLMLILESVNKLVQLIYKTRATFVIPLPSMARGGYASITGTKGIIVWPLKKASFLQKEENNYQSYK